MSAHPSATSVSAGQVDDLDERVAEWERREPKPLDLPPREYAIALILSICFDLDREVQRGLAAVATALGCDAHAGATEASESRKHGDATPHVVADLVHVSLPSLHAQLATVLIAPVARLVDHCLDVDESWEFLNWPQRKQADRLRRLFDDAGIGERFVTPGWASAPDPDEDAA